MLEQVEKGTRVGKLGCEHCVSWREYGSMNIELYGFVGRWGRCLNEATVKELNTKYLNRNTTLEDRTKTNINRLSIESQILSTCPTYNCPRMKIPLDKEQLSAGIDRNENNEISSEED